MDRHNLTAPGWSHVLSTTNDVAELDGSGSGWGRRRRRCSSGTGAIRTSISSSSRGTARSPIPEVRVFERTADMLRYIKALRES